jgi:hypothetical protein
MAPLSGVFQGPDLEWLPLLVPIADRVHEGQPAEDALRDCGAPVARDLARLRAEGLEWEAIARERRAGGMIEARLLALLAEHAEVGGQRLAEAILDLVGELMDAAAAGEIIDSAMKRPRRSAAKRPRGKARSRAG